MRTCVVNPRRRSGWATGTQITHGQQRASVYSWILGKSLSCAGPVTHGRPIDRSSSFRPRLGVDQLKRAGVKHSSDSTRPLYLRIVGW